MKQIIFYLLFSLLSNSLFAGKKSKKKRGETASQVQVQAQAKSPEEKCLAHVLSHIKSADKNPRGFNPKDFAQNIFYYFDVYLKSSNRHFQEELALHLRNFFGIIEANKKLKSSFLQSPALDAAFLKPIALVFLQEKSEDLSRLFFEFNFLFDILKRAKLKNLNILTQLALRPEGSAHFDFLLTCFKDYGKDKCKESKKHLFVVAYEVSFCQRSYEIFEKIIEKGLFDLSSSLDREVLLLESLRLGDENIFSFLIEKLPRDHDFSEIYDHNPFVKTSLPVLLFSYNKFEYFSILTELTDFDLFKQDYVMRVKFEDEQERRDSKWSDFKRNNLFQVVLVQNMFTANADKIKFLIQIIEEYKEYFSTHGQQFSKLLCSKNSANWSLYHYFHQFIESRFDRALEENEEFFIACDQFKEKVNQIRASIDVQEKKEKQKKFIEKFVHKALLSAKTNALQTRIERCECLSLKQKTSEAQETTLMQAEEFATRTYAKDLSHTKELEKSKRQEDELTCLKRELEEFKEKQEKDREKQEEKDRRKQDRISMASEVVESSLLQSKKKEKEALMKVEILMRRIKVLLQETTVKDERLKSLLSQVESCPSAEEFLALEEGKKRLEQELEACEASHSHLQEDISLKRQAVLDLERELEDLKRQISLLLQDNYTLRFHLDGEKAISLYRHQLIMQIINYCASRGINLQDCCPFPHPSQWQKVLD